MGELINLIQLWLAYRTLCNPMTITLIVAGYIVLLLTGSVFVTFKNGIISLVAYCVLLFLGVSFLLLCPVSSFSFTDDLKLAEEKEVTVREITAEGLVFRPGFLSRSVPLLGIRITGSETDEFQEIKDRLNKAMVNGKLTVCYSGNYTGVIVLNDSKEVLNELFLKDGLALASSPAPQQYVRLQESAKEAKLGLWKSIVGAGPLDYCSTTLCALYLCVLTGIVLSSLYMYIVFYNDLVGAYEKFINERRLRCL